jgi:hypothetical protein
MARDADIWRLTGNLLFSPHALVAGRIYLRMAFSVQKEMSFELNLIFVPN